MTAAEPESTAPATQRALAVRDTELCDGVHGVSELSATCHVGLCAEAASHFSNATPLGRFQTDPQTGSHPGCSPPLPPGLVPTTTQSACGQVPSSL